MQQVKEIELQQEPWAVAVGPDGLLYVSMALMYVNVGVAQIFMMTTICAHTKLPARCTARRRRG